MLRADVCGKARLGGYPIRSAEPDIVLGTHPFSTLLLPHWHQGTVVELFPPPKVNPIYGHHVVMMLLVVHLIIGHRRLRDVDYYRDDAMSNGFSV